MSWTEVMFAFWLHFTVCTTRDAISSISGELLRFWMSQTNTDKNFRYLIVFTSVLEDYVNSVPHSKAADLNKRRCFWNGTSLTYLYFHCASFFFSPLSYYLQQTAVPAISVLDLVCLFLSLQYLFPISIPDIIDNHPMYFAWWFGIFGCSKIIVI